jgi:hypothetical protein
MTTGNYRVRGVRKMRRMQGETNIVWFCLFGMWTWQCSQKSERPRSKNELDGKRGKAQKRKKMRSVIKEE